MACVVVTFALAALFMNDIRRYYHLSHLCDHDGSRRAAAMRYIIGQLGEPKVLAGAQAALEKADRRCFDDIVHGLAVAGRWGPGFGPPWVRYLSERAADGNPEQRCRIAVELGKMLWLRQPCHDDARIPPAIEGLMADEDPNVRMNALSAAACLPEPRRSEAIRAAENDPNERVKTRASYLLHGIIQRLDAMPHIHKELDKIDPDMRLLAQMESVDGLWKPIDITEDMPPMVRLQAVRVSTTSVPEDLWPLLGSDASVMRDLACTVATQRFDAAQCRALARKLIGAFDDSRRMSGVMLAALTDGTTSDAGLMIALRVRAGHPGSWLVEQHCKLALWMLGEPPPDFDPFLLIQHLRMPRSTMVMATLRAGHLEALDWLLNPFGEPPAGGIEGLRILLGEYRYWHVLRRSFDPRIVGLAIHRFPLWTDQATQRGQLEFMRDDYLIYRPLLRFDPQRKVFTLPPDVRLH